MKTVLSGTGQTIRVPAGAWSEGATLELTFPRDWTVEDLPITDAPSLSDDDIRSALAQPLGSAPLAALAKGRHSVAIAVDDITRPTKAAAILDQLVETLISAGLLPQDITVIVAVGAHRPSTEREIELKIGSRVASRVRVATHDPKDVRATQSAFGGVPVRVNPLYLDAELRIGVGCVIPHPFAGFSGGGKIVLPGLADLEAVTRSHKYALMGLRGGTDLDRNKFREDMERAVRTLGMDFCVNVVINGRSDTAGIFAGDFITSHRAAAAAASRIGATRPPTRPLDALILNAFPKDSDLIQAEAAFVALRSGMLGWLTERAPVVLTAACSDGMGVHQLLGPGGRLYRRPAAKTFLGAHPLLVYAPGLSTEQGRQIIWDGYSFAADWNEILRRLADVTPDTPCVGVLACGPLHTLPTVASEAASTPIGGT